MLLRFLGESHYAEVYPAAAALFSIVSPELNLLAPERAGRPGSESRVNTQMITVLVLWMRSGTGAKCCTLEDW